MGNGKRPLLPKVERGGPGNVMTGRRRYTDESGMVAVEFAFILILLLIIVVATVDFSILLFNRHVLANAAREGARAGAMAKANRLNDEEIRGVVEDYSKDLLISFGAERDPEVIIEPDNRDPSITYDLKVTVKYTYDYLLPNLLEISASKEIETSSTMKTE